MKFEGPNMNFATKNKEAMKFVYYTVFIIAFVFVVYIAFLTYIFQTAIITGEDKITYSCKTNNECKIPGANGAGSQLSLADQLASQGKINKFDNYDELQAFLEKKNSGDAYGRGGFGGGMMTKNVAELGDFSALAPTGEAVGPATDGIGGGSADFSLTNIQVEGVDEADIIKTDGKYIYAVTGNNLFIVDAYPASGAQILSKIEFESTPQEIYINDNRLVVYGYDNFIYTKPFYSDFRRQSSFSFFKVFDITDRVNPKQVRNLDFEGSAVDSRMVGDYVYFITTHYAAYYEDEIPYPKIIDNDVVINKEKMMPIYYIDVPDQNYNFTTVSAINIKDESVDLNSQAYLLSYGQNLFVSQNNIYITYTKYINEWELQMEVTREYIFPMLPAKKQQLIRDIEAVPDYILNKNEKLSKISYIVDGYIYSLPIDEQERISKELGVKMREKFESIAKELEKTVIHKIAINNGNLEYKATGEVTGNVLNQFSMDEHNGYFRIATTKNRTWSQFEEVNFESYSNLFILDENLKVVSGLEGLAKKEQIYSVRFMQDRAYMVTFEQIDPLFVIDLKDPLNPKVLGELKIPGFSTYLHPYDNNLLIGLGKDTYVNEWGGVMSKGVKLSLFDVADIGAPKEIDTYVLGGVGTDSYALYEHKAFLFSKEKNLLVIPATIMEDGYNWESSYFKGSVVFDIDETGFKLKGQISHEDELDSTSQKRIPYYSPDESVKRNLYIDDVLYSFSDRHLMMNKLENLELVKDLELVKGSTSTDDIIIIN